MLEGSVRFQHSVLDQLSGAMTCDRGLCQGFEEACARVVLPSLEFCGFHWGQQLRQGDSCMLVNSSLPACWDLTFCTAVKRLCSHSSNSLTRSSKKKCIAFDPQAEVRMQHACRQLPRMQPVPKMMSEQSWSPLVSGAFLRACCLLRVPCVARLVTAVLECECICACPA